jgi:competence protein ComEC
MRRSLSFALGLLLALTALSGAFRYAHREQASGPSDIRNFVFSGPVRVNGVVEGDRDERERSLLLHTRVTSVDDGTGLYPASGLLVARLPLSATYIDGDRVELRGTVIQLNDPGATDYRGVLARQGVSAELDFPVSRLLSANSGSSFWHTIYLLRIRLDRGIRSVLPEPEATLGAGLALGTRRISDPSLSSALADTNADMIAIATGYNVTVLGMLTLGGLAWLIGRRQSALAATFVMAGYALLLGPYPSIIRAAVMGTIVMAAVIVGRPHATMRALIIACASMVAIDPSALTSISFPLTAAATAGVVWLFNPLRQVFNGILSRLIGPLTQGGWAEGLSDSAAITLAAVVPALPVVMAFTHRLSISSLPVNLVLFPFIPWLTAFSLALAVFGSLWHPLAYVFAPAAFVLLRFVVIVVRAGAMMPGGRIDVGWFNGWIAAGIYTAGLACYWAGRSNWLPGCSGVVKRRLQNLLPDGSASGKSQSFSRKGWMLVVPSALAFVLLALFGTVLVARLSASAEDPSHLQVTFLDVGVGSAILAQSGSERILVNAGPEGNATVQALDRILPPWQRALNLVVLTDSTSTHSGGLDSVVQRYRVGAVVNARGPDSSDDWQTVQLAGNAMKLPQAPVSTFELGQWQVVVDSRPTTSQSDHPGTRSDGSRQATVIARRAGRTVILSGDLSASVAADLRSATSQTETRSLAAQSPLLVLETTRTASPPEWNGNSLIYRTMENGDISADVGPSDVKVRVARGPRYGLGGVH